jgi:hypothetical protein
MKRTNVTARLREGSRKLHARVKGFFDAPPGATASPLELLQAALDELERRAYASGRGARVFPYSGIVVHVAQPAADRAAIDAVFGQLPGRLRERLAELRCEMPPGFRARVDVSDAVRPDGIVLWVECSHDDAPSGRAAEHAPELRVTVAKGQCDRADYTFEGGTIAIGRGAEPADAYGRVRRNHVAFVEVRDGVTETVARAHARLEFDPASRAYHLFNESNSNPTFLLRGGRSMRIAPRDPRGVRVQSGDEVQLGRAILALAITDAGGGTGL